MPSGHRTLLVCILCVGGLTACDPGISETESGAATAAAGVPVAQTGGNPAPPSGLAHAPGAIPGTKDTVVATVSSAGPIAVAVGSHRTVSVVFTSSDGRAIRGLGISGTTLPSDWSGLDHYSCTLVGVGSSCIANLTYAPVAVGSGTVTLNYIYIDNANEPQAPGGSVTIPYMATSHNNVIAVASPTGQIGAAPGAGAQSVTINFTTDDGNAATDLSLTTDLTAMPSGWSSPVSALNCPIVSTGSGCQLVLNYAPASMASGTLALSYSYMDDAGTPQTGAVNVPYSTITSGNVVANAAPAGQINAIQKTGSQPVTVTFTTNDGRPASRLALLTELAALPAGWSSKSSQFSCGSVSTGNGCQLILTYAPASTARGTLTLDYDYLDSTGSYNVGSLNVEYAGTTNDNVVGTATPSGQINAIVGMSAQPLSITFTTDDARPATALALITSLTALPPGWSSTASSFACAGLSSGAGCQLDLTYAPPAAASGSFDLMYSYRNNAGEFKTASVNVPYKATTDNNVTAALSSNPVDVTIGSSATVTITFTTDDGNLATGLLLSGLTSLPAGWSTASTSFSCVSVSTGVACQASLTYAPVLADSGSLPLTFSYTNNSGINKNGAVTIAYAATP